MKTRTTPTTRNWNVNVLLHTWLQPRIGHDRRHFHQLFYQLRVTQNRAHRDVLRKDLGHFNDLLGIGRERVEELEHVWQLFHRLPHRCIKNLHHGSDTHEVRDVLHDVPLDRSCGRGSARTPSRTPAVSSSNNSENTASPAPQPCPSSVPVGRRTFHQTPPCQSCGGRLRTGPLRRSAAHVSAGVAAFSAMRSRDRHAASCRPPGVLTKESALCVRSHLSQTPC